MDEIYETNSYSFHVKQCNMGKYYQVNIIKKMKKKKFVKNIKIFLKKKKKKSDNMAMNDTKISQKMKNKSLLSIEKNTVE